jgi:hypothetical protein
MVIFESCPFMDPCLMSLTRWWCTHHPLKPNTQTSQEHWNYKILGNECVIRTGHHLGVDVDHEPTVLLCLEVINSRVSRLWGLVLPTFLAPPFLEITCLCSYRLKITNMLRLETMWWLYQPRMSTSWQGCSHFWHLVGFSIELSLLMMKRDIASRLTSHLWS